MKSPRYIPIWFIAAYPDVVLWYKNKQYAFIPDEKESLTDFNLKVFKIKTSTNQKLTDSNNNHSSELLRNLVDSYKNESGVNKLEVSL